MSRILKSVSLVISFALASAFSVAPAKASQTIIDTLDGSTIIGDYTFTITIPQLGPGGSVRIQIVDVYGAANYGIVPVINIQNAGSYTYSIDPFGTIAEALLRLPAGSWGSNAGLGGVVPLRPGLNQIRVDYIDDNDLMVNQPLLTNIVFKHACEPGTYSTDGGVPLTGSLACTNSPANSYVATTGATSATACPSGYTSPAGSDALSDCIAPVVTQTTTTATTTAAVTKPLPTLAKGKKMKIKALATQIEMSVPAKAKATAKVAKSSRKICKVSGTSIKALKVGSCVVTVKVKPKKGSATTKTTTITVS